MERPNVAILIGDGRLDLKVAAILFSKLGGHRVAGLAALRDKGPANLSRGVRPLVGRIPAILAVADQEDLTLGRFWSLVEGGMRRVGLSVRLVGEERRLRAYDCALREARSTLVVVANGVDRRYPSHKIEDHLLEVLRMRLGVEAEEGSIRNSLSDASSES
ncbi:MAG: hypothetical protein DRO06_04150 [Thermoproteota archaeon]|nr:MAG: hypothetical protein DRO06_04150 [Candidatus Korarchaeota archaeon]